MQAPIADVIGICRTGHAVSLPQQRMSLRLKKKATRGAPYLAPVPSGGLSKGDRWNDPRWNDPYWSVRLRRSRRCPHAQLPRAKPGKRIRLHATN